MKAMAMRRSTRQLRQRPFVPSSLRSLFHLSRFPFRISYLLFPFSVFLWVLAYQAPFAQTLHIGGDVALQRRDDERPFLRGAHESEPVDPRNWRWWELPGGTTPYRWTRADTAVNLPGIGAGAWIVEIVAASGRPDGTPATSSWQVGAAPPQDLSIDPRRRRYHLIGRSSPAGDLRIQLRTAPFAAPGDPRELGVVLHEVRVRPVGAAGPAWPQLGWLTLCLGLIYAMQQAAGNRQQAEAAPRPSPQGRGLSLSQAAPHLLTAGTALAAAYALALHRTALTVFTPTLALLLAACAAMAAIGMWVINVGSSRGGGWRLVGGSASRHPPPATHPTQRDTDRAANRAHWISLLLLTVLGFALRLGGMLHPHTMFSDARFNANNLFEVSLGEVLLSAGLPSDAGGGSAPYPPGPYLLLLPAQLLLPEGSPARVLLVQSGVALLDSLLIGAIGLLLLRMGLGAPAALLGAACYLLPVSALESFSIGEYANLGGQVIALGFVGLLVLRHAAGSTQYAPYNMPHGVPQPQTHAPRLAPLAILLAMGLLAHSGVTLSLGAFVAAAWGLSWFGRREGLGPWRLGLVAAAGLATALLIFYSAPSYVAGVLGRAGGGGEAAGSPPLEVLGRTAQAIVGVVPPDLRRVPLPIPLGVAALAGLALIALSRRPGLAGLRLGLGAWWGGMLLSQGLLLVAGQGVRWSLFLYPALCLGAGPLLGALWRRGRAGRLVAAAAVGLIVAQGLFAWVVQLRDYFHI